MAGTHLLRDIMSLVGHCHHSYTCNFSLLLARLCATGASSCGEEVSWAAKNLPFLLFEAKSSTIRMSYSFEVVTEDVAGASSAVREDGARLFLTFTLFFHPDSEFLTFSVITDFLNLDPIYTITSLKVRERKRLEDKKYNRSQTCVTMT